MTGATTRQFLSLWLSPALLKLLFVNDRKRGLATDFSNESRSAGQIVGRFDIRRRVSLSRVVARKPAKVVTADGHKSRSDSYSKCSETGRRPQDVYLILNQMLLALRSQIDGERDI